VSSFTDGPWVCCAKLVQPRLQATVVMGGISWACVFGYALNGSVVLGSFDVHTAYRSSDLSHVVYKRRRARIDGLNSRTQAPFLASNESISIWAETKAVTKIKLKGWPPMPRQATAGIGRSVDLVARLLVNLEYCRTRFWYLVAPGSGISRETSRIHF
jgi:hypothetical protein